jgi:hypothetical protein
MVLPPSRNIRSWRVQTQETTVRENDFYTPRFTLPTNTPPTQKPHSILSYPYRILYFGTKFERLRTLYFGMEGVILNFILIQNYRPGPQRCNLDNLTEKHHDCIKNNETYDRTNHGIRLEIQKHRHRHARQTYVIHPRSSVLLYIIKRCSSQQDNDAVQLESRARCTYKRPGRYSGGSTRTSRVTQ